MPSELQGPVIPPAGLDEPVEPESGLAGAGAAGAGAGAMGADVMIGATGVTTIPGTRGTN